MMRDQRMKPFREGQTVLMQLGGWYEGKVLSIKPDLQSMGPQGPIERIVIEVKVKHDIGLPKTAPNLPGVFILDDPTPVDDTDAPSLAPPLPFRKPS